MCAALYCDPRLASIGDPSLTRRNECPRKYLNSATCFAPSCYTSSVILGLGVSLMRRREFIALLGSGVTGWPLAARAQQADRMRRIGVLMGYPESDSEAQTKIAAFRDGLQKLGWTKGRNTRIDTRWATPADAESMERFAKELVALQPDLILSSTTPTTAALLQQTRTIPIVFATVANPVGSGFVASFPRPGGNVTGFVVFEASLAGKWLELLKEIAPRVNRIAFLFNPATATYAEFYL